ncbi:MAG: carboxylate--amine ligase, partial [Psychrobacter sp.]
MNNLADNSNPSIPVAAWLAEGQSSQRDMLESLQSLKSKSSSSSNNPFQVIASHRHDRPEIFEFADIIYR